MEIADLLESIEISCQRNDDPDKLIVTRPSFRIDIEREADLIEEVARLYGYNSIPATLPKVNLSYPEQDSSRLRRLAIAEATDLYWLHGSYQLQFYRRKTCRDAKY